MTTQLHPVLEALAQRGWILGRDDSQGVPVEVVRTKFQGGFTLCTAWPDCSAKGVDFIGIMATTVSDRVISAETCSEMAVLRETCTGVHSCGLIPNHTDGLIICACVPEKGPISDVPEFVDSAAGQYASIARHFVSFNEGRITRRELLGRIMRDTPTFPEMFVS